MVQNNMQTDSTNKTYTINSFAYQDIGNYYVTITNSYLPNVTLQRNTITIIDEARSIDSLALVALYNATDGSNWNDTTNWLSDEPLDIWYGITIYQGRVTELDLSTNSLTGTVNEEIKDLTNLQSLNLFNNSLESLPLLSAISNTTSIDISNNNLDFSSIIPNLRDENDNPREDKFIFIPQSLLDTRDTLFEQTGNSTTLSVSDDHQDNVYQWYKDGDKIIEPWYRVAYYSINSVYLIDSWQGDYWASIN